MAPPSRSLKHFVDAQDHAGAFATALTELRAGRKRGHWIWFVFPQLAGLGSSPTAQRFGLASVDEAVAYLAHPVLGPRLHLAAAALVELDERDPVAILGALDARKLRSSMTLFREAAEASSVFDEVLQAFFGGDADPRTIALLGG